MPLLNLFKHFTRRCSQLPIPLKTAGRAAGIVAATGAAHAGTAWVTDQYTQGLPPEECDIYWRNYADPESCSDELARYYRSQSERAKP